jgi:hypothetical protein
MGSCFEEKSIFSEAAAMIYNKPQMASKPKNKRDIAEVQEETFLFLASVDQRGEEVLICF